MKYTNNIAKILKNQAVRVSSERELILFLHDIHYALSALDSKVSPDMETADDNYDLRKYIEHVQSSIHLEIETLEKFESYRNRSY